MSLKLEDWAESIERIGNFDPEGDRWRVLLEKFELSSEPMLKRREDSDAGGTDERVLALHTMCCGLRVVVCEKRRVKYFRGWRT